MWKLFFWRQVSDGVQQYLRLLVRVNLARAIFPASPCEFAVWVDVRTGLEKIFAETPWLHREENLQKVTKMRAAGVISIER